MIFTWYKSLSSIWS